MDRQVFSLYDKESWRFDVSDAERFGTVVSLFGKAGSMSIMHTDKIVKETLKRLDDLEYDHEKDYIVMTGDTVLLSMVIGIVLSHYGSALLLIYSSTNASYRPRRINLDEPAEEN
jgi:hypothetical protein